MNILILILVLIFGLSWIGGIIYYGIQSVRSFLRKDKWDFEDNIRSLSTCVFIGWLMPFIIAEMFFEYVIEKITDKWD